MENIENVPKILPVWHDYWIHKCPDVYCKPTKLYKNGFPDFGGSGIDVSSGHKGLDFTVAKYSTDKKIYGANVCSLPFFPPMKVHLEADPCMAPVHASNNEIKRFNAAIKYTKRSFKGKGYGEKVYRKVSSLYSALKNLEKKANRKKEEIVVLKTVLDAAANIPKSCQIQDGNFNYLGGCLVSSKTDDGNPALLHPTGKSLNRLGITPIVEHRSSNKTFRSASPRYSSKKLNNTCIQKIRSNFTGHSFVQQEEFCYYVNFTNPSEISTYELKREHGSFVNIQTSPYSPVDFLSTDETGVLEVFDVDSWKTSWCSDKYEHSMLPSIPRLKDCSFGSHPKSVLLLTENSVHAYDLRTQNQSGSLLFSKHFSSLSEGKFVTIKCLSSVNPFQSLISSTNHLYMIDERYPEKPVLIWNHVLRSLPFYCDVACVDTNNFSSDAVALLGSQESAETCLLSIRFPKSKFQPVSLSNPLYPSVTTDFCDSLKLHNVLVSSSLEKRIKNPLVGVSIIPRNQKKGFTCFQLSSYGDIFYQDYKEVSQSDRELTYSLGTGCVLSPPDKILPRISSWTDFFSEEKEPYFERDPSDDRILNLKNYSEKTSNISFGCNFCNFNAYSRDKTAVLSSSCPSCGLSNIKYNDFMTEFRNLSLCSGPSEEESPDLDYFDMTSIVNFNAEEYERIFKVWDSPSDNFQPYADMDTDSHKSGDSCASSVSSYRRKCSLFQSEVSYKSPENEDEPKTDMNASQEFSCDIVPPSQDIRPLVGETLRTSQAKLFNLTDSFGGF